MTTFIDAAKALAADRSKSWGHDRRKTVGASEVGKCIRRTVYSKLGLAPDDGYVDTNGFAKRGDTMEDAWSAPLVDKWSALHGGKALYTGQANQVTLIGKKVPLSATPDGLAVGVSRQALAPYGVSDIGKSKSVVIEIKSIDPRYAKQNLPKFEHVPQTMTQLGLIRVNSEHKPDYGVVIYVDASDYFDVRAFPVKYDEAQFKSLVKRADYIMKCDDPNKVLPEGKIRGGSECSECPFAKQCLGFVPFVAGDDPKAPPVATVKKVERLAEKVAHAAKAVSDAEKAKLTAEADLYIALGDAKRNFIKGSRFVVHAKKTDGQNRSDTKAMAAKLKELGVDPEQFKLKTKPSTSLSVQVQ